MAASQFGSTFLADIHLHQLALAASFSSVSVAMEDKPLMIKAVPKSGPKTVILGAVPKCGKRKAGPKPPPGPPPAKVLVSYGPRPPVGPPPQMHDSDSESSETDSEYERAFEEATRWYAAQQAEAERFAADPGEWF